MKSRRVLALLLPAFVLLGAQTFAQSPRNGAQQEGVSVATLAKSESTPQDETKKLRGDVEQLRAEVERLRSVIEEMRREQTASQTPVVTDQAPTENASGTVQQQKETFNPGQDN